MHEVVAQRQFDPLYIWLDIGFLCLFAGLLLWKKKYATVLVGLFFGAVYMIVDYGVFHLLCRSRTISEGHSLFWVLLWMSVSYGFTNFTWIWLWISKFVGMVAFHFRLVVLLPADYRFVFFRYGYDFYSAHHRRVSRRYGADSNGRIWGIDRLEFAPFSERTAHLHPLAARYWNFSAAGMGGRSSAGRHPECAADYACAETSDAADQFFTGNQFGHAVYLCNFYCVFSPVYRTFYAQKANIVLYGTN